MRKQAIVIARQRLLYFQINPEDGKLFAEKGLVTPNTQWAGGTNPWSHPKPTGTPRVAWVIRDAEYIVYVDVETGEVIGGFAAAIEL